MCRLHNLFFHAHNYECNIFDIESFAVSQTSAHMLLSTENSWFIAQTRQYMDYANW